MSALGINPKRAAAAAILVLVAAGTVGRAQEEESPEDRAERAAKAFPQPSRGGDRLFDLHYVRPGRAARLRIHVRGKAEQGKWRLDEYTLGSSGPTIHEFTSLLTPALRADWSVWYDLGEKVIWRRSASGYVVKETQNGSSQTVEAPRGAVPWVGGVLLFAQNVSREGGSYRITTFDPCCAAGEPCELLVERQTHPWLIGDTLRRVNTVQVLRGGHSTIFAFDGDGEFVASRGHVELLQAGEEAPAGIDWHERPPGWFQAMLRFAIAFSAGDMYLLDRTVDWDRALRYAQRHDATLTMPALRSTLLRLSPKRFGPKTRAHVHHVLLDHSIEFISKDELVLRIPGWDVNMAVNTGAGAKALLVSRLPDLEELRKGLLAIAAHER